MKRDDFTETSAERRARLEKELLIFCFLKAEWEQKRSDQLNVLLHETADIIMALAIALKVSPPEEIRRRLWH